MPDIATTLTLQEPVVVLPVREFQKLLEHLKELEENP